MHLQPDTCLQQQPIMEDPEWILVRYITNISIEKLSQKHTNHEKFKSQKQLLQNYFSKWKIQNLFKL